MNDSILAIHPKANFRIMSANLLFDESAETRQSALDASDHCFVYADITI